MAFQLVVIGTSLGGLNALKLLLGRLPTSFPVAVVVVQHRHKDSDHVLSSFLQQHIILPLKEVEDKDLLVPGQIYLAPPDYHLLVDGDYLALSTDEPVWFARPSIDVLFESAADCYGSKVIGVILTGANHDGAHGLAQIKAAGGVAIVQDPTTAECQIMPQAAIAATPVDAVLPLPEIAPYLIELCTATFPATTAAGRMRDMEGSGYEG